MPSALSEGKPQTNTVESLTQSFAYTTALESLADQHTDEPEVDANANPAISEGRRLGAWNEDGLYLNQAETELKTDEKTIGLPLRCGKRINRKLSLSDYATTQASGLRPCLSSVWLALAWHYPHGFHNAQQVCFYDAHLFWCEATDVIQRGCRHIRFE